MPSISPSEVACERSSVTMLWPARGGAFQIWSRSVCSSTSTVVAPISNVTTPTAPAMRPVDLACAPSSSARIAAAAVGPIRSISCASTAPRATSTP